MKNKDAFQVEAAPGELSPSEQSYRNMVIPYLLTRAYHIPGNSWFQDWYSYMTNNHPLFGICLHHKYHPIKPCVRLVSLVGSVLFGLAVTNIIYLSFVFTNRSYDHIYLDIKTNTTEGIQTGTTFIDDNVQPELTVTNGNLALWTVGAALHAFYDNIVWSLAACTCCMNGRGMTEERLARFRSRGVLLVMLLVIMITALATFAVAVRSAVAELEKESEIAENIGLTDEEISLWQARDANEFEFMIAYFVELVLNFFVYYPVVGSILFSGCLTCGRYPVIGGRPYEIRHDVERPEESQRANSKSPRPQTLRAVTPRQTMNPNRQPPISKDKDNKNRQRR